MSIRKVKRTVVASAAAVAAGGVSVLAFAGPAFAGTGVGANGNTVPGSAAPVGAFTPGAPFSSGQGIDVTIPANSVLSPGNSIFILECAAPNGVLPTSDATCDGNTVQGPTITVSADGSLDFVNQAGLDYPIYSLPNSALGETAGGQPVCGVGAANECVLYIGQNQGDFTAPHFFSQVFQVSSNVGNTGANPGDGTPEVPLAVGLPLLAMGAFGGTIVFRRRRAAARSAA